MSSSKRTFTLSTVGVAAATLALAACSPRDDSRADADADADRTVVAQSQSAPPPRDDRLYEPQRPDPTARDTARSTAGDIAQAGRNAGEAASNKVSDAVITTSVNAELARDPQLSAMAIDVDTEAGRVALQGSAPDRTSRERATQIAAGVDGVVSVDNRLRVQPSK
jgi:osmotically-inducible protein OsmY